MRLIPRREWTSYAPAWVNIGRVSTVFIHHTVTNSGQEIKAAMRDLEAHARALGHRAIDYSFVAKQSGERAEGRGWFHAGGHTINNNSTSYGISALGDFTKEAPSPALLDAIALTIREGIALGAISPNPVIRPHSDVFATACPGALKASIPKIRALVLSGDDDMPLTEKEKLEIAGYTQKAVDQLTKPKFDAINKALAELKAKPPGSGATEDQIKAQIDKALEPFKTLLPGK